MKLVQPPIPKAREHELQKAIVDALRARGHLVYETTAYRQKGASGVDKGIPDLLVLPKDHKRNQNRTGQLRGVEVKVPGKIKWSSPEQELAWLDGAFVVVQSPAAALDWLERPNKSSTYLGEDLHLAADEMTDLELYRRRALAMVAIEEARQKRRAQRRSR